MHSGDRAQIAKGGPRALTFQPNQDTAANGILTNCKNRMVIGGSGDGVVTGENGGDPTMLVHGWYTLDTDLTLYWQQLNPSDIPSANPLANGRKLTAGQCVAFFVTDSQLDGGIAIKYCEGQDIPTACAETDDDSRAEGFSRVNRVDTIVPMALTGNNATYMDPACAAPKDLCGTNEFGQLF